MADTEDTRECEAMRKMFVGGLNRDTTDETFFEYFGQFGNMADKVVIKDPQTKTSRGFGFITYDCSDAVEKVFQARPHTIDDKKVDVKRAMPREFNSSAAHSKVTKLFVGGVGPDLTPEDLREYIESRHPTSFGTIDNIDFLKDKTMDQNKGFGFLECSSTDFADRLTICEQHFNLKGKKMGIKKAEPKPGEGGAGDRGRGRGGFAGRGGGSGRGGVVVEEVVTTTDTKMVSVMVTLLVILEWVEMLVATITFNKVNRLVAALVVTVVVMVPVKDEEEDEVDGIVEGETDSNHIESIPLAQAPSSTPTGKFDANIIRD